MAPLSCNATGISGAGFADPPVPTRTAEEQVAGWKLDSAHGSPDSKRKQQMKDFSNASFSPDLIRAMDEALEGAVGTLPHPVSSMRVRDIAESILRSAQEGERDPRKLRTMALVEMQLRSPEK